MNSRTRKGGFGTAAVRELPLRKKNEEFLPGPAQYVVKNRRVKDPKVKQAVFKSTTNRLHSENSGNVYAPPPGSYEVASSFDKTQGKKCQNDINSTPPEIEQDIHRENLNEKFTRKVHTEN